MTYLGPAFAQADIEERLRRASARFEVLGDDALLDETAAALANGKAVGWFRGRMEIEVLAAGNCFLRKDEQDARLRQDYKSRFDLD